jgi:hypothetical protein
MSSGLIAAQNVHTVDEAEVASVSSIGVEKCHKFNEVPVVAFIAFNEV